MIAPAVLPPPLKMPLAPRGDHSSRQRNRRVRRGWSSFDRAWGGPL